MARISVEERAGHLARWRASGLSRAAYCRDSGVSYRTFLKWAPRSAAMAPATGEGGAGSGFIEVRRVAQGPDDLRSEVAPAGTVLLRWAGSRLRLTVGEGCTGAWVAELVRALAPC